MFSGGGGGLPPTSWRDRARWGKPAGPCQGKVDGNPRDTAAVTGLKGNPFLFPLFCQATAMVTLCLLH